MADPEANIIFGTVIDERMGDDVQITVIATGFDAARKSSLYGMASAQTGAGGVAGRTGEPRLHAGAAASAHRGRRPR